ncbi:MAG TPA: hypothetical protein VMZ26_01920 [Pyrinomonadaceae bacterium]|nr:hypothetical protein [Pyrinomonadaceae bacterium]
MLISLLLIAIITAGGLALSYLIDNEEPLMWRLAAGSIIGSTIFGTITFVSASLAGLGPTVVSAGLLLTALPLVLFFRRLPAARLKRDWSNANSKLQGASARKSLRFAYYAFFFLLFFFFFDRAMLESAAGIFTGGSQNLGDLPFHLGAILGFSDGNNFPPQNPSFAGARFSYPFIADFLTACFVKLGADVRSAMFVQNVSWAFALLVILERFVFRLTRDRLAARIAPALLFFTGGLGFLWFFSDYWGQTKSFFEYLAHLPKDYTIGDQFRWGNSMVVLFITQRSLLLGMPLTLIVLTYLWKVFERDPNPAQEHTERSESRIPASSGNHVSPSTLLPVFVGLLAGLLPLVHMHSLAVLFVVGIFLFILRPERWKIWSLFAAGVAVVALPELLWSMAGSASETAKFFAWHFGWDKGDKNFLWFWFTNTGLFIPLLAAGLYFVFSRRDPDEDDFPQRRKDAKKKEGKMKAASPEPGPGSSPTAYHPSLLFFLPFAFLFVVSNVAKLAPWEWDNIKVLIYWFVGSVPFVSLLISRSWRKRTALWKAIAAICFVVLIASGALDVWRTVSAQINNRVFDKDAVEIAEQIKRRIDPKAMFLNAPTYNSAIVLSGRRSLMRYPGHLSSHGINYGERESDVKRMYQGGDPALRLMEKYGIDYVLVSPEERNQGGANEQFFSRFPVAAESGQYRVYKIK